jgi:hypothetical protein
MQRARFVFSSVTRLPIPYVLTLSLERHDIRKTVTELKMDV